MPRRTRPETVAIVDQFIEDHGVGEPYMAHTLRVWLAEHDIQGDASHMFQVHSKSHQTGNPAKYVAFRVGQGCDAYWYAMEPNQAPRSSDVIIMEIVARLKNLLERRPDAIAVRDRVAQVQYASHRRSIDIAISLLEDIATDVA